MEYTLKSRNGYSIENPEIGENEIIFDCIPIWKKVEDEMPESGKPFETPQEENEECNTN